MEKERRCKMIPEVKLISASDESDHDIIYDHKTVTMPNKYAFPTHTHDMCELLYFVSGEASYYIEGNVYSLRAGDIVFIRSARHHMLVVNGGADYERYDVMFSRSLIPDTLYEKTKGCAEVVSASESTLIKELFSSADKYYSSARFSQEEYGAFLRSLILTVCCEFVRLAIKSEEATAAAVSGSNTFHLALMHINKNLSEIKSIESVCKSLYITKRYLHYLFKKNLGMTPKKYITEKRLIAARKEILGGRAPTEVYRSAGFNDYTSFYRNYKAHYGYAPSEQIERRTE